LTEAQKKLGEGHLPDTLPRLFSGMRAPSAPINLCSLSRLLFLTGSRSRFA
jgi:hypothetical protein